MNIKEAIERLEEIRKIQGDHCQVYFDCPKCKESFSPNTVVKMAVHLVEKK